jgi:hypothetical protein
MEGRATVKSFRFYIAPGKRATGAGCLLGLLSVVVMLALGFPLAYWIGSLTGVVVVSVAVLVGVAFFALGAALCAALRIRLWEDESAPR